MSHPAPPHHSAPVTGGPLPAQITGAAPRWAVPGQVALAWGQAVATALVFWQAGRAVDGHGGNWTVMIVLTLVAAAFASVKAYAAPTATTVTESRLRRSVVEHGWRLGPVATANTSGQLLSLATGTSERAAGYRAGFRGPIIGALTVPVVVLVVMAITVDPVTAGVLALLLVLVPILIGAFQRRTRPVSGRYRREQAQLTAGFLRAIQALPALVHFRAGARTAAELARDGEAHRRGLMRLLAVNQLLILVVDASFGLLVTVAGAGLAVARVSSGTLTLGQGVAIVLMTTLVIGPVDVVGQFFYIGVSGRAAEAQLAAHLASAAAPADARGVAPGITIDRVTAGWPRQPPVLRGLSLRVEPGERVALVGPSGSGKSTVVALLMGRIAPAAGQILVGGDIALVDQRPYLFLGSIADNLRLAAPTADDERLWSALEVAGFADEVRRLPAGLATPVGEHGRLLSGGQAQRLAIARAALRDAPILILDEPTSQVDLAAEADILAALDRLSAERTVLMIAHRPGAILAADRVVTITDAMGPRA